MKTCTECRQEKPLSEFYWNKNPKNKKTGGFYHSRCKSCAKARSAVYNAARYRGLSPEEKLRASLKAYGITPEQHAEMLEQQGGACPICLKELEAPYVDHDHSCCPGRKSCGKCVRGLLCSTCNTGLGLLGDSRENLARAADYLASKNVI